MEIRRNFATALKRLKAERGKSMTEFSEELEISLSSLQGYLSCKGNPNLSTLEHIAKRLGVEESFLLFGALPEKQSDFLLRTADWLELLIKLEPEERQQLAELFSKISVILGKTGDQSNY